MSGAELLFLAGAGVLVGMLSTVVGLASLVSYPALLFVGLPPIAANVSNTVALVATGVGAARGSRAELAGQGRALVRFCAASACGGGAGAALLLTTPADVFEVVVPWLIAGASVLLLAGPRLRSTGGGRHAGHGRMAAVFLVGTYGGYFGAAAGVLMLAALSAGSLQTLARANAAKNMAVAAANGVAAAIFAAAGPVYWSAALALAAGSLLGGWLGPAVVRRLPAGPLRAAIAIAGLCLAIKLAFDAGLI